MRKLRWHIAQFFEKRWWQQYLKKKDTANYLQWKRDYWFHFLEKIGISLQDIKSPVLDVGCGPAGIYMILENQEVLALDPLLDNYKTLSIYKPENYKNVAFKNSTLEQFETQERYKTIFCLNALNHFIDIESSIQKLACLTDKNAQVIVSVDAHNYTFLKYFFRLLPFDILHPHQYDIEEYIHLFEKHNFQVQKTTCLKKEWIFSYWVVELVLV